LRSCFGMLAQALDQEINIGFKNSLLIPYCSLRESVGQKATIPTMVRIARCTQYTIGSIWRFEEQFWVFLQLITSRLVDQNILGSLGAREGQCSRANANNIAVMLMERVQVPRKLSTQEMVRGWNVPDCIPFRARKFCQRVEPDIVQRSS